MAAPYTTIVNIPPCSSVPASAFDGGYAASYEPTGWSYYKVGPRTGPACRAKLLCWLPCSFGPPYDPCWCYLLVSAVTSV